MTHYSTMALRFYTILNPLLLANRQSNMGKGLQKNRDQAKGYHGIKYDKIPVENGQIRLVCGVTLTSQCSLELVEDRLLLGLL